MQYDSILKIYRESSNADVRNTALRTLGRARDPELIQQTLSLILSPDVKEQDIYLPAAGLRGHTEGIEMLFVWLTENWDAVYAKLPPGLSMLGSMVSICTNGFSSQEGLDRVQKFFEGKDTKGYDQALAQSCDSVRAKISWVGRDREDVKKWVEGYQVKNVKAVL